MHSDPDTVVEGAAKSWAESATVDPLITIIVITYNRAQLAADCVTSLATQETPFPFEIVVVDDGSTDDTESLLSSLTGRYPDRVRYVRQSNGGVNSARNKGISEARGRYVGLMDDDELAPPGYLVRVVERFATDDRPDGVGGPCRDNGGGVRTCPNCSLASVDVPGTGVRQVSRLLGGNMVVRAEVFAEVGVFDSSLSGRGDDDEWFYRASRHGLRMIQDPDLWVWHRRDHFTLGSLCRQAFRQGTTISRSMALQGIQFKPRWKVIAGGLVHAVRRRCARGIWLASKEVGAIAGAVLGAGSRAVAKTEAAGQ